MPYSLLVKTVLLGNWRLLFSRGRGAQVEPLLWETGCSRLDPGSAARARVRSRVDRALDLTGALAVTALARAPLRSEIAPGGQPLRIMLPFLAFNLVALREACSSRKALQAAKSVVIPGGTSTPCSSASVRA